MLPANTVSGRRSTSRSRPVDAVGASTASVVSAYLYSACVTGATKR